MEIGLKNCNVYKESAERLNTSTLLGAVGIGNTDLLEKNTDKLADNLCDGGIGDDNVKDAKGIGLASKGGVVEMAWDAEEIDTLLVGNVDQFTTIDEDEVINVGKL